MKKSVYDISFRIEISDEAMFGTQPSGLVCNADSLTSMLEAMHEKGGVVTSTMIVRTRGVDSDIPNGPIDEAALAAIAGGLKTIKKQMQSVATWRKSTPWYVRFFATPFYTMFARFLRPYPSTNQVDVSYALNEKSGKIERCQG